MYIILLTFLLTHLSSPCTTPFCTACSGNICFECQSPYTLFNGYCVGEPCLSQNCVTCDYNQYWCIQCSPMYQLKAGVCTVATYVIVAPIIIFIIAFAMCVFYCIFRAHHRKMRRRALEQLYNQQRSTSPALVPTSDHILDNPDFVFTYEEEKGFCSICLEGGGNLITQCGHYFHADCFSSWIRRHKICPICNNKDIDFVIVMLCMKCKKRYYHYETFVNFLLQVKVDMERPCNYCVLHKSSSDSNPKIKLEQGIESHQMILSAPMTSQQEL